MNKKIYLLSYGQPTTLMKLTHLIIPWLLFITTAFLLIAFYFICYIAPVDAQQGNNYYILYFHVPFAWLSLLLYVFLSLNAFIELLGKNSISLPLTYSALKLGFIFTSLTLITGSLWGLPVWGALWVWDARLTSVFILWIFYILSYFILQAFKNKKQALHITSIFILLGLINIPIIKYSVTWWYTLHQQASISFIHSSIDYLMLTALFLMFFGLLLFCIIFILIELRIYFLHLKLKNYVS
uniref:ABC transporter subunit C n=1 Tax=Ancoracysta twista TaxID=2044563 RepID=A0A2H4R8H0_9EUKA|nr:ABC transporter subunit C [Ancoracysta twista]ATY40950.1 ABC transporter subunit C [Ancoracysta twista]